MSDTRIHYLDGLRGVLALIVFAHHFFYLFYPELMLGGPADEFLKPGLSLGKVIALTPINILFNPTMAINFFFLLSGYVQSFHYLKHPDLRLIQLSFLKRYFRLAIPTTAVLILVFIFHRFNCIHKELLPVTTISGGWVKSQLPDSLNFFQLLKFGLFDCFQGDRSYYQVLWTMAIELLNSWMVLILLFATHNMKHKNFFFVFWILVQLLLLKSTHSISFTAGILLCSLHLHSQKFTTVFSQPAVKYLCLLIGLYLASYPIMEYHGSLQNSIYKPLLFLTNDAFCYIVGNIFLFSFVLQAPRLKIMFRKKIFRFYGSISFMFYLLHFLLLFSFAPKVYDSLRDVGFSPNLVVTFIATFGVVTLVAFIFYKYIDKPCLTYCNRLVKKLIPTS